jgi:hypothetical protein
MAMTYQEYIQKTGCQLVADQLVSGFPHHKLLGSIRDNSFTLTEDGQEYLAQFENSPVVEDAEPKTRRGRRKAVEETEETETPSEE